VVRGRDRDLTAVLHFRVDEVMHFLGLTRGQVQTALCRDLKRRRFALVLVPRRRLTQWLIDEGMWEALEVIGWTPNWVMASPRTSLISAVREKVEGVLPGVRLAHCTGLSDLGFVLHKYEPKGLVLDYALGRDDCRAVLGYLRAVRPWMRLIALVPADEWDRPDRSDRVAPCCLAEPVTPEEIVESMHDDVVSVR
jgi:hypothetical protein